MRHVAALLLAQLGGNATPTADDVKKILGAVAIEADEDRLNKLVADLEGKDVEKLIEEGREKLATVPAAGGAVAGGAAAETKEDAPEEEKKVEEEEESDDDMGFGLFD